LFFGAENPGATTETAPDIRGSYPRFAGGFKLSRLENGDFSGFAGKVVVTC